MPAAPSPRRSVRMKRMKLILQKALDVSVHSASLVDLRACLESECRGDEELLNAFFPPVLAPEHHSTEELSAQAVLSLRQKVETLFEWLCESHDVEKELLELEDLIQLAEEKRLQEATKPKEPEAVEETPEKDLKPEERVRMERLNAKKEEQQELEKLVKELEEKNKQLQMAVEEKRRVATADVQKMQRAANQLQEVSHLAKDYASAP